MKRCDWDKTPAAKKAPSSGKVFFDPLQRPILVSLHLGPTRLVVITIRVTAGPQLAALPAAHHQRPEHSLIR